MRPRSLLLLFLVVAGLGSFVWFFERDLPSTDQRAELAKKVLPLEADTVIALSIERDGSLVRFEREPGEGGDWRVVEPLEARADETEIEKVLDSLAGLTKERTLEDFEPEQLGLSSPWLTVRLTTADEEWALEVGEEVPATSNVIATVEGRGEAYVVSGDFRGDLEKEPGDWRSKDVFPFDQEAVSRVVLRGGEEEVVLRRNEEDFGLEAPLADEADQDKVADLLDVLTGLEIEAFVDGPLALDDLGLEPAVSVISLEVGAEESTVLRLGTVVTDDEDSRYAWADGQVIEINAESGEELVGFAASPASDWRSRAWTTLEVFEMDEFRLGEGGSEFVLERSEGDWLRGGVKIAYTTASDVLYALGDIEIQDVREMSTGESDNEDPILEIFLSSKDREETLRLFPETNGVYPALREGRDVVLELSKETVDELMAKIAAARDADPLPSPSNEGDEGE